MSKLVKNNALLKKGLKIAGYAPYAVHENGCKFFSDYYFSEKHIPIFSPWAGLSFNYTAVQNLKTVLEIHAPKHRP